MFSTENVRVMDSEYTSFDVARLPLKDKKRFYKTKFGAYLKRRGTSSSMNYH